jgi:endoribonuclease Dicer
MFNNRIHLENNIVGEIGDNKILTGEMARMYFSKMGKLLLEVEEKYSNQIKKIVEFKRREHRVLITTSVTEEGFDIPGCNLVISFDTPFSLKSYIQIKGRARKKNSRYIIFTNHKSEKRMIEHKKIYDNTINAIYELAINQIAKESINAMSQIEYSPSYKKVATKGGALLNTNYALELVKSYFTSLKKPNRPYFHFIETSNICFKCVIKFP